MKSEFIQSNSSIVHCSFVSVFNSRAGVLKEKTILLWCKLSIYIYVDKLSPLRCLLLEYIQAGTTIIKLQLRYWCYLWFFETQCKCLLSCLAWILNVYFLIFLNSCILQLFASWDKDIILPATSVFLKFIKTLMLPWYCCMMKGGPQFLNIY